MKIYDSYSLRDAHLAKHPDSHFFDRDTLKFFGERFSEMRLLKSKGTVTDGRKTLVLYPKQRSAHSYGW